MMSSDLVLTKATKQQRKGRVFLSGPSGSGKSYTALTWAAVLGESIVVIDTEHGSALDYADRFEFDHLDFKPPYTVDRYIAAIAVAADAGADVLVIDSLSHAWAGKGGLLEMVDHYAARNRGDSFSGWREATPKHLEFIEALLSFPGHLICTARAKMDYQLQQNDRGKWEPVKLGLAPVQRDGMEYEFSVVGELTVPDNVLRVTKSRCEQLQGYEQVKPDDTLAVTLRDWLGQGKPVDTPPRPTVAEVYEDAKTSMDPDGLLTLYRTAERFHLLPSPVTWPDSEETTTLGEFITARGREARAYAEHAKTEAAL